MIVKYVMQAISVQVLDWRHLKNALMEHIATQLALDIVFYVQKVIGEVLGCSTCWPQTSIDHSSIHPFMIPFIDVIDWCFNITCFTKQAIRTCWLDAIKTMPQISL